LVFLVSLVVFVKDFPDFQRYFVHTFRAVDFFGEVFPKKIGCFAFLLGRNEKLTI